MRKLALTTFAVAAATTLILSGCSNSARTDAGSGDAASGFESGSTIGVALPAKTSENWVLAGDLFTKDLTDAGFKPDVQYAAASGTVANQQDEIQSMVTKGAKVIIIGAADGGQLGTQVKAAHDAGAVVIAYDRLILNTEDVDYYVAYDNFKVGELQGQALLDGMAAKKADGPYNVELFSGSSDDANSAVFFDGAMDVLQPKIDDGTLVVVSGQTDIKQTATAGWKPENAQSRMDTILQGSYPAGTELDGVLSPNDTLARAIITSVEAAGRDVPVVTGQDSEVESVKSIVAGVQYSTIYKDTRALVAQAIEMAKELQEGGEATTNDDTYDNGSKIVPAFLLAPVIVTKENAAEVYKNDPALLELTK